MVMATIVGRPYWFGLSLPRRTVSLMDHRWWWTVAVLWMVYVRHGGARSVVWCLRHAVNPRYVYAGLHHLDCSDNTVDAVTLILMLREERAQREAEGFEGHVRVQIQQQFYGHHYVTPLTDRTPAVSRPEWLVATPPADPGPEVIEGEITQELPVAFRELTLPIPGRQPLSETQMRLIERMSA